MPKRPAKPKDNTAAIAAQFGISLKALRVYGDLGMLSPPRNAAGWRIYGEAEVERLHAILSLKQLGLPLARIAELLKAGPTDLTALLSIQEEMLEAVRRETEHTLTLVQIARRRIRDKGKLAPDELAALVRRISRTVIRSTPGLEALAQRVYTPEQIEIFRKRRPSGDEAARDSAAWERIYTDIDKMMPDGNPLSKKGLDIARRMMKLIQATTRGDKELWNSAHRFWKEAVSDPRIGGQLPMKQAHWDFVAKAMEELKCRGELKP